MPKVRDWTWKSEKSFPLFLHAVSNDDLKTSCRALCKRLKNRLLRKSASARSRSTAFRGKQPLGGTPGLNAAVHAAVAKAFACILQQTTKDSRPCFLNRGRIQRRSQVPRRTELGKTEPPPSLNYVLYRPAPLCEVPGRMHGRCRPQRRSKRPGKAS